MFKHNSIRLILAYQNYYMAHIVLNIVQKAWRVNVVMQLGFVVAILHTMDVKYDRTGIK